MSKFLRLLGLHRRPPLHEQSIDLWSIGLFQGADLSALAPAAGIQNPILQVSDITDRRVQFIADPFVIKVGEHWHLFFEMFDQDLDRGVIASAISTDLRSWEYTGVVLTEAFHLSYPFVFEHQGSIYMIPESKQAREVRLYRATSFPGAWEYERTLLKGKFVDSTLVQFGGLWWIFAARGAYSLAIFYAEKLDGPWKRHRRRTPYWHDKVRARPGGRMIPYKNGLLRFTQDCKQRYGHQVRAFFIERLTPTEFVEYPLCENPILAPGGEPWNSYCMHQIDPWRTDDGQWWAIVDGAQRILKSDLSRFQEQQTRS